MKNFLLIIFVALFFCAYSQKTISIGSISGGSVAGYGLEGTDTLNVDTATIAAKSFVDDKFGGLQLNSIPIIDADGNLKEYKVSSTQGIIFDPTSGSEGIKIMRGDVSSVLTARSLTSDNNNLSLFQNSGFSFYTQVVNSPQFSIFWGKSKIFDNNFSNYIRLRPFYGNNTLTIGGGYDVIGGLFNPPVSEAADSVSNPTLLLQTINSYKRPIVNFYREANILAVADTIGEINWEAKGSSASGRNSYARIKAVLNPNYTSGTFEGRGIDIIFEGHGAGGSWPIEPIFSILSQSKNIQAHNYPNSRNDISTTSPTNFLYTNSSGVILSAPIINGIYSEFYYADAGTSTPSITKKDNTVSMVVGVGAVTNNTVSIPNPSAVLFGTNIEFYSTDASGTYNNIVSCPTSAIVDGGVAASSTTLLPNETVNLKCHRSGASTYIWVVTNRY